jgi:hypothetical protein
MAGALWMSVLAFTLLFALLLLQRYRFLSVKARLSEAILRAEDAGLLDE